MESERTSLSLAALKRRYEREAKEGDRGAARSKLIQKRKGPLDSGPFLFDFSTAVRRAASGRTGCDAGRPSRARGCSLAHLVWRTRNRIGSLRPDPTPRSSRQ